jgi:hypothetical protein
MTAQYAQQNKQNSAQRRPVSQSQSINQSIQWTPPSYRHAPGRLHGAVLPWPAVPPQQPAEVLQHHLPLPHSHVHSHVHVHILLLLLILFLLLWGAFRLAGKTEYRL